MKMLDRYIAKTVMAATMLVLLATTGLTFIITLLEELKDVGSGDYGIIQALFHVILEMPHSLYQFFPMIMLLGGVLGLGMLSTHQELIVMRTAGVSTHRITRAVFAAAFVVILIATGVGEWLSPLGNHFASVRKQSEQNGGQAVATLSGVWMHEGNNFLNIRRVVGLHHLEDVTRYQFNANHQLLAAYYIKSLDLVHGKWVLHDVVKTSFAHNQTETQTMAKASWDLALNPNLLNVGVIEPAEMSLATLHEYARHLTQSGLQASDFQFEFWKRVFQPLTTLVMILLALPFVMRSSRSVTTGWRILFGVALGFGFYILNAFLGQFSVVFQLSPFVAAIFPTVFFGVIGYGVIVRFKN